MSERPVLIDGDDFDVQARLASEAKDLRWLIDWALKNRDHEDFEEMLGSALPRNYSQDWTPEEYAEGLAIAEAFSRDWPRKRVELHQLAADLRNDVLLVDLSGLPNNSEERLRLFHYDKIMIFPREPKPTVATGRVRKV